MYALVRSAFYTFFSDNQIIIESNDLDQINMDWEILDRIKYIFEIPKSTYSRIMDIPVFGLNSTVPFQKFTRWCVDELAYSGDLILWNDMEFESEFVAKDSSGWTLLGEKLDSEEFDSFRMKRDDTLRIVMLKVINDRYPDPEIETITSALETFYQQDVMKDNEDIIIWSMFMDMQLSQQDELDAEAGAANLLTFEVLEAVLRICIPYDNKWILSRFERYCRSSEDACPADSPNFFSIEHMPQLVTLMKICIGDRAFVSLKFLMDKSPLMSQRDVKSLLEHSKECDWLKLVQLITLYGKVDLQGIALLFDDDLLSFKVGYILDIALIDAIRDGKDDLIVALVEKGRASPNFLLNSRNSCLSIAAGTLSLDRIQYLINNGADINSPRGNLLMASILLKNREVFNYLCPPVDEVSILNVNVNVVDPITKMTSLAFVCAMGPNRQETTDEMFHTFIAHVQDASAYINLVNFAGWSPLAYAVSYGQLDMIAKLIELGASVTEIPLSFQSWRAFIAKKGKREKLQAMLPLLDTSDTSIVAVAADAVSLAPSSPARPVVTPAAIAPPQSQASSSPSTPTQTTALASTRVSPNAPAPAPTTAPSTTASPQAQSTAPSATRGGKGGKGGKGGGRGKKRVQSDPPSDHFEKSQKLGKLIRLMQSLTT